MRSFFKHFGLMVLALLPVFASAALQNGKVQVGFVKGKASLLDPQAKKQNLSTGQVFQEGYKVETDTDSTAELILSNGSTLIMSAGTLLELRTFRQVASDLIVEGSYQKLDKEPSPSVTEIEVKRGKVLGEVRKLNPMSSYVIKTPVGVARIRGTVYTVEYVNDETGKPTLRIGCVHGSVDATIYDTNSGPISVGPGKLLVAVAPQAPTDDSAAAAGAGGAGVGGAAGTGTGSGTSNPANLPGFQDAADKNLTVVLDTDFNSAQLKELADILAQSPSLPKSVSDAVYGQASLAPAPGTTSTSQVNGSFTNPPGGGTAGTTGGTPTVGSNGTTGGSSTVSEILQKLNDTTSKAVEQQQTVDPSATGG